MLDSTAKLIPPAPLPHAEPLGLIALLRTLKNNPLEAWTRAHFEQPIVMGGLSIGRVAVISDPAAIRHVLLDNAANYRKDWMQRRILSAGLANGLLSAEGGQWKAQRRALAPLFSRKAVLAFSAAMVDSAQTLVARLAHHQDRTVDIAVEATRTTLDVLERTIFSDGFGRGAEEIRVAMKSYFDTIGQIDPFDLLGLPAVVPRPSRWRLRPTACPLRPRSPEPRAAPTPGGGPSRPRSCGSVQRLSVSPHSASGSTLSLAVSPSSVSQAIHSEPAFPPSCLRYRSSWRCVVSQPSVRAAGTA